MSSLWGRFIRRLLAPAGATRNILPSERTSHQAAATGRGLPLKPGTVHVWIVHVDVPLPQLSGLLDVLQGEERSRAARLRTTEMRLRFVAVHGALRYILSRYLEVAPGAIRFRTTDAGKPYVPGVPLTFSLSHSDEIAVCAVAPAGQIGVDVERIRIVGDADQLAARYFAPGEATHYAAAPAADRPATFFSTWTRKEAFVKAIGAGLRPRPDSFEVDVVPALAAPRLTVIDPDWTGPAFSLRSFTPHPGYVAAVALDRPIDTLEFFYWTRDDVPA